MLYPFYTTTKILHVTVAIATYCVLFAALARIAIIYGLHSTLSADFQRRVLPLISIAMVFNDTTNYGFFT